MSNDLISIDDFSRILTEKCQEYTEDVKKEVEKGFREIGSQAKSEVKEASPSDTGAYKKGWIVSITKDGKGTIDVIVHNKKYRITHLLENGHLIKNGTGRVYEKTVPPIPHIADVQKHAEEMAEELLKNL